MLSLKSRDSNALLEQTACSSGVSWAQRLHPWSAQCLTCSQPDLFMLQATRFHRVLNHSKWLCWMLLPGQAGCDAENSKYLQCIARMAVSNRKCKLLYVESIMAPWHCSGPGGLKSRGLPMWQLEVTPLQPCS